MKINQAIIIYLAVVTIAGAGRAFALRSTIRTADGSYSVTVPNNHSEGVTKVEENFNTSYTSIIVKADGTGDYPTIQAAVDAAVNGDIILLQPGIYTGSGNHDIDFKGKAISVLGATDDPNNCVVDCNGIETNPHRGFKFIRGENTNSVLRGITIINGYGPLEDLTGKGFFYSVGGAIYCNNSNPTLTNCIIKNNSTEYWGAICNYRSSPVINNCVITGNSVNRYGGGIYNYDNSSPNISNCTISNNWANSLGGGIFNSYFCNPDINNCVITYNSAFTGGGGIYNTQTCNPIIKNCIINGNSARYGGAIFNDTYSGPSIKNCIIFSNSVSDKGGGFCNSNHSNPKISNCVINYNSAYYSGSGIFNYEISNPDMTNCTICYNVTHYNGAAVLNWSGSLTIKNCVIWGNSHSQVSGEAIVKFSDIQGGWSGNGNIDAETLFADDGFHLTDVSPCIDAGDPNYIAELNETDIDGEPRIIGGRIDMGADEFHFSGDFDYNNEIDFIDFDILVDSWMQNDPLRNIAPPDNIVDIEDLSVFCEHWLDRI